MPDLLLGAVAIALVVGLALYFFARPVPESHRAPLMPAGSAASVAGSGPRPQTIIRTYRGKQQADTTAAFQADAAALAREGYEPTSQSWAQGQWGCGASSSLCSCSWS